MAVHVPGIYAALESGIAIGVAGLVYRTDLAVHILFPDGAYRYDWPDQGLLGDFSHDRAKYASFWGRWQSEGSVVEIERPDASLRFAVESDAIVDESGMRFVRLPDEDGIDLTGLWLREASASDKPRITFLGGERFETSGGLLGLIAEPHFVADAGPFQGRSLFEWPDGGGTYERAPCTLILRRDDGAAVHMLALVSPSRMRLGYTWFTRQR
jgi:hypothetical protein